MPPQKHDFTKTELKAGTLVLMSLAFLALFVGIVTGMRPAEPKKTYYARFSNTGGLNKGADVRFGGAKVGKVVAINIDPADPARIRVELTVRKDVPVNAESEAYVTQTTFTAEKHLEISTGASAAARLADGVEITSRLGGLLDRAADMAEDVRSVLDSVKKLLGMELTGKGVRPGEGETERELVTAEELFSKVGGAVDEGTEFIRDARSVLGDNRKDMETILAKFQEVEDAAKSLVADLDGVVAENRPDLRAVVESSRRIMEQVSEVSERLVRIADVLQATLDNAQSVSENTRELLEGSRPLIEDTILDLRDTVRSLEMFSRTVAEQPHALIRGASPQGRE
jgi:phospholipid/cholesterol/gamma-HCH transport system substrate-binding protein